MHILEYILLMMETKHIKEITYQMEPRTNQRHQWEKKSLDSKDESLEIYDVKDREEKQTNPFEQSWSSLHVM